MTRKRKTNAKPKGHDIGQVAAETTSVQSTGETAGATSLALAATTEAVNTVGEPLFGDDHALWIAFRATRSAVRGLIGEDAPQPDPEKLADQAVCMADFLRSAPDASDEAVVTQLSMRGKARGGDDTLRFKVRVFRNVLAHAERHLREAEPPAPTDAELAAKAAKPDPRDLSLKLVKAPLALTETAKGR